MAEVLGTISAVVGIAEAGSALYVSLSKIAHAAACPDKLKDILRRIEPEVSTISAVSSQLASTLRDDETVRLCKLSTLTLTRGMAEESLTILRDAQKILQDVFMNGTTMGLLDRLKMYSIEKKVDVIRADIDRLRSKLLMIMEVIKFARGVVTNQNSPQEREIIVALKKEVMEKTIKCQRLSKAISIDASSISEQLSKLDSFFNSNPSESEMRQYKIVDQHGNYVAEKNSSSLLAWKIENISQIITELEETRKDVARFAQLPEEAGIWEVFKKNGVPHYRHTAITIRLDGPRPEAVRSITSDPYPVQEPEHQLQIPKHEAQVTDIYIALMGAVGTGKSTFVNVCLGSYLAPTSQAPGRCTETIEEYHFMYTNEIKVHLVDTPGFDHAHRSEREILTDLLEWTKTSQGNGGEQKPKLFSGILYFHKITDAKPQLSTHRNIRMLEKLCVPTSPTASTPSSPPPMSSTVDTSFDPMFDTTFYPPSTTSTTSSASAHTAYTATSYYSSSTTSSTFTPTTTTTTSSIHSRAASLHPIILVTTNWEYFLGDDDRALQHESDLRTHDDYWGAMIRRGSTVVRYASADRESAMGVLGMLKALEKVRGTSGSVPPGIPSAAAGSGTTASPGATTGGVGFSVGETGETGNVGYFPREVGSGRDDMNYGLGSVEEPGEYERGRALSLSDTQPRGVPDAKGIDAEVGELLAEFTTVVVDGPMMPAQHRRWTTTGQTH